MILRCLLVSVLILLSMVRAVLTHVIGISGSAVRVNQTATLPEGWAFGYDVALSPVTRIDAFDLIVQSGDTNYIVSRTDRTPGHVHMVGAPGVLRAPFTASSSFTFTTDRVENPLTKPFRPEKRWTCWSSGNRNDWYAVNFGRSRLLNDVDVYFFSDQPQGGCDAPEAVSAELYRGGGWHAAPIQPQIPTPGKNTLRFASGQPERAEQIRLNFRDPGKDHYPGLYGFEPHFADAELPPRSSSDAGPLAITGDKWITSDGNGGEILVSRITVTNCGAQAQPFFVRMQSDLSGMLHGFADVSRAESSGSLYLCASGTNGNVRDTEFMADIKPGETRRFTFACSLSHVRKVAEALLARTLATR